MRTWPKEIGAGLGEFPWPNLGQLNTKVNGDSELSSTEWNKESGVRAGLPSHGGKRKCPLLVNIGLVNEGGMGSPLGSCHSDN